MRVGEYEPVGGWEQLAPPLESRCAYGRWGCGDPLCQAIAYQLEPECVTLRRIRKEMRDIAQTKDSARKYGKIRKILSFLPSCFR